MPRPGESSDLGVLLGVKPCSVCGKFCLSSDPGNLFNASRDSVCYSCLATWWPDCCGHLEAHERETIEYRLKDWLVKFHQAKVCREFKELPAKELQDIQIVVECREFKGTGAIRFEMSIFGAIMNYAVKKRYVRASQRFDERPKLKTMRRDEFTLEEYRRLHPVGRKWIAEADNPSSVWYRTVTYNMILIACNTGMRPEEMKNLRWCDIMPAKDREGREIVVLFVQGKGKSRKLVAPKSVGDYLERIRAISKATEQDDRVFSNITGKPAKTLYSSLIADLKQ
jgi:integrase